MANKVELIVGTYEEFLLGYKVEFSKNEEAVLVQTFSTKSHTASIRCLATCGKYLASGAADDRIFIYDMINRREIQILMHHEGTVNTLAFTPDATHILSGSDDGRIVAVRVMSWQIETEWKKAHAGSPVTKISCHPSGKLALSMGNDLTLRTWDLIKGRLAYTTNLKSKVALGREPDNITWAPSGEHFTITGPKVIQIWLIDTASLLKEQSCESKPISVCWLNDNQIVIGLENGKLMFLTINADKDPILFEAHKKRVKSMAYGNGILATASSNGDLSLWKINLDEFTCEQISSINIGLRPICIALIDLTQFNDDMLKRCADDSTEEQKHDSADEVEIEKSSKRGNEKGNNIENIFSPVLINDKEYASSDVDVENVLKVSFITKKLSSKKHTNSLLKKDRQKILKKLKRKKAITTKDDKIGEWIESVIDIGESVNQQNSESIDVTSSKNSFEIPLDETKDNSCETQEDHKRRRKGVEVFDEKESNISDEHSLEKGERNNKDCKASKEHSITL